MPLDPTAICTVCIPTFQQSQYLRPAIESVAAQTYPVRLLVSNDASPDDTAEVMKALQNEFAFEAVNQPVNLGMYQHVQWMMRQPQTPYIMRLDSDDLLDPEYIEVLIGLLERNPTAGYAHSSVREIDADGHVGGIRSVARTWEFEDSETSLRRLLGGFQVAANIILFRRDALVAGDSVNSTNDLTGVEDWDRGVRLSNAGWGNVHSPRVLASYRVHDGPERPRAGRKIRELVGLNALFSGNLLNAYRSRGWDEGLLRQRRVEMALASSDILDQAEFGPGEREAVVEQLVRLADDPKVSSAFGDTTYGRTYRRSLLLRREFVQSAKRTVKRIVYGAGNGEGAGLSKVLDRARLALRRNPE